MVGFGVVWMKPSYRTVPASASCVRESEVPSAAFIASVSHGRAEIPERLSSCTSGAGAAGGRAEQWGSGGCEQGLSQCMEQ